MENKPEEQKPVEVKEKPRPHDTLRIRCPRCFHNKAIRYTDIRNIKQAVYICENCGRIVKYK